MAKHSSPLRLEAQLVENAKAVGSVVHRSAAEQIEQWASIGREISRKLSDQQLLNFHSGLLEVDLVEIPAVKPVNPMDILNSVNDTDFKKSLTSQLRAEHDVIYEASKTHAGYLDQITDGTTVVGKFQNGVFTPKATI